MTDTLFLSAVFIKGSMLPSSRLSFMQTDLAHTLKCKNRQCKTLPSSDLASSLNEHECILNSLFALRGIQKVFAHEDVALLWFVLVFFIEISFEWYHDFEETILWRDHLFLNILNYEITNLIINLLPRPC